MQFHTHITVIIPKLNILFNSMHVSDAYVICLMNEYLYMYQSITLLTTFVFIMTYATKITVHLSTAAALLPVRLPEEAFD